MTRGTTNPNRLRRMDRWIAATHGAELRRATTPLAIDLGYGAAPWTAVELLLRLRAAAPRTQVVGVEIDPARVTAAKPYECEGLTFRHGGFEVPVPGRPTLIRAANVLRQYDEEEVAAVWERLCARLEPATPPPSGSRHATSPGAMSPAGPHSPTAPYPSVGPYPSGGLLVEGTCDEIGQPARLGRPRPGGPPHGHLRHPARLPRPPLRSRRTPPQSTHPPQRPR